MQTVELVRELKTLAPSAPGERVGMMVPGPDEAPAMEQARAHMRKAWELLSPCVKALGTEPFQDSPAQVAMRAALAALGYAGSTLGHALDGARVWEGGQA